MKLINNFKPRLYQQTILAASSRANTLVVLPTGLGKTAISMMLALQRLSMYPTSKIVILAPTKPLVEQHLQTFKAHIEADQTLFVVLTGMIKPEKRIELWSKNQFIFSTPQGLENDVLSNRINLKEVSLMVFDECHRAVGDYAYVFLSEQYIKQASHPLILGLTASPGSDIEKISEVCTNLSIEQVEVRTDEDLDVKPYIQNIELEIIKLNLSEPFIKIKKFIETSIKSKLLAIKEHGIDIPSQSMSRTEILSLQKTLHSELALGHKSFEVMKSISLLAETMKMHHALELLESQGIPALAKYFQTIQKDSQKSTVKAVQNLVKDVNFRSAFILTETLNQSGVTHPKLEKLKEIIADELLVPNKKIIIFNQYRDSAQMILEALKDIKNIKPILFVGQASKSGTGLSQKKQIEIINKFREGHYNVVVMTSVGEEGLDIPKVDTVVFYEPIPSAIRHIQRRGRTGRQDKGKMILLVTKNTRDESYQWSAYHKEKRMHRLLKQINSKLSLDQPKQRGLSSYVKDDIKIIVDHREKASGIIKELFNQGVNVQLENLKVADYILSSRVGVELKTVEDFVDSILDGRLLEQIKWLKENFQRPLIIIEGIQDIYKARNVHPNAIRGMIATITVSYGIPLLQTKNHVDTAGLLYSIAKREQAEGSDFSYHIQKKNLSLKEQQEYIVGSLPGIGGTIAKPLLRKYKTIKKIINASEEDLQQIENIGKEKAKKIREVLDREYEF